MSAFRCDLDMDDYAPGVELVTCAECGETTPVDEACADCGYADWLAHEALLTPTAAEVLGFVRCGTVTATAVADRYAYTDQWGHRSAVRDTLMALVASGAVARLATRPPTFEATGR